MEERRHYRGGLVWPVILICAGIVFLLNNMGILSWSVWQGLARLWPVLLIAGGLDLLIGRRSLIGSAVVALVLIGALAAAIWLDVPNWGGVTGPARTETVSEPLEGIERAEVDIEFGVGTLRINALNEGNELVHGELELLANENLEHKYGKSGDVGELSLRSKRNVAVGFGGESNVDKEWKIDLSREVPLTLSVEKGVGQSFLDLSRLQVTEIQVDGGVGETEITLPREGDVTMKVDGGVGEVTILVPETMYVRMIVDGGLGNVNAGREFERSNDAYQTPGFASAENKTEIRVNGGIGRVNLRRTSD